MSSIKITADSTCDLSKEIIEKYDIAIVPLYINMDDNSYKDGIDVKPEQVYEYFEKTGSLATTSAVTVEDYREVFSRYSENGYDTIHLNIGSEFSSSFNNAKIAAEDFDNVYIIDTENLSTGSGHLVILAAELAQKGLGAKEIMNIIDQTKKRVDTSFVLDNLIYLHKGGRCSGLKMLGANLLKLKPCIEVVDGKMAVGRKYRGKLGKSIMKYVDDKLEDLNNINPDRIFITHSGHIPDIVEKVQNMILSLNYFKEIIVTTAGCTISSHCGPGTLGILFIRK